VSLPNGCLLFKCWRQWLPMADRVCPCKFDEHARRLGLAREDDGQQA